MNFTSKILTNVIVCKFFNRAFPVSLFIKFLYSEKATKFNEIPLSFFYITYLVARKKEGDFVKHFVSLSENLNFILCTLTAIRKPSMALFIIHLGLLKLKKKLWFIFRSGIKINCTKLSKCGGANVATAGRGHDYVN